MRVSKCILLVTGTLLIYGTAAAQKSTGRSVVKLHVLEIAGPSGRISIGGTLASAKKAFPVAKGAREVDSAMNFAILQRPGWGWWGEKANQAFEVNLRGGKIAGIARTTEVPNKGKLATTVTELLRQLPAPASKATGKTASAYCWVSGKNARFLVVMQEGMMGSGPLIMEMIGAKDDLKLLNYRADDIATLVKQLDMGAEAMKKVQRKPKAD